MWSAGRTQVYTNALTAITSIVAGGGAGTGYYSGIIAPTNITGAAAVATFARAIAIPALAAGSYLLDLHTSATPALTDEPWQTVEFSWDGTNIVTMDAVRLSDSAAEAVATKLLDLANGIEAGVTVRGGFRAILAACVAKCSGIELLAPRFRDLADSKNRISATVDAIGNPLSVTLDLS